MNTVEPSAQIDIEERLRFWLAEAVLRFQYLYPKIEVEIGEAAVTLRGEAADDPTVQRDFLFSLYRQKIYAETLPLRKILIEGVTGFASRTA